MMIDSWGISCEIALRWMSLNPTYDEVHIGSLYGLVLSGNNPLLEAMLTQLFVAIWCLGHNELTVLVLIFSLKTQVDEKTGGPMLYVDSTDHAKVGPGHQQPQWAGE